MPPRAFAQSRLSWFGALGPGGLPAELRSFAGLTRAAVLLGQGNRFELWDEARWTERRDEWLKDEELPEAVIQLRCSRAQLLGRALDLALAPEFAGCHELVRFVKDAPLIIPRTPERHPELATRR